MVGKTKHIQVFVNEKEWRALREKSEFVPCCQYSSRNLPERNEIGYTVSHDKSLITTYYYKSEG